MLHDQTVLRDCVSSQVAQKCYWPVFLCDLQVNEAHSGSAVMPIQPYLNVTSVTTSKRGQVFLASCSKLSMFLFLVNGFQYRSRLLLAGCSFVEYVTNGPSNIYMLSTALNIDS